MKKTKNCKNLRCILSLLLAVLMITSVIPMSLFGGAAGIVKAKAEGTTYKYASDYDGTSAITRGSRSLHHCLKCPFKMTVCCRTTISAI